jgi:cytochrome c oxidase subunit IV
MKQHISSIQTNVVIFGALIVLLFATVGAAYMPLGDFHFATAMVIAAAKAVLIVMYFMHVKYSHRLTAIICAASFLWLGIMIALTLTDYMTRYTPQEPRGWLHIPGK